MNGKKSVWMREGKVAAEKKGWLAGIISSEAAADREDERKRRAAERERKSEDAAAKRKLQLEKQAAKNRRYDAITQVRKERGGSGLVILFSDRAPESAQRTKTGKRGGKKRR